MTVGVFHPEYWTQHGHWDYLNQTPGKSGYWKGISFRINHYAGRETDFVVVHQDLPRVVKTKASAGGVILVTGEEKSMHDYSSEFLSQFDLVVTTREDIVHPNVLRTFYMHPWRVKKTFDELNELKSVTKVRPISAIISNLKTLPSQRERFEFMEKLKIHLGDRLDWYCKGQSTFITDKWDGIAPYDFSVAMENSRHPYYFTEKITDCFLAFSMPVYSGCPNIKDFFDERSYLQIDPLQIEQSFGLIDEAIADGAARMKMPYIMDSRKLVLDKYHFIAAVSDIIRIQRRSALLASRKLFPQSYFEPGGLKKTLSQYWARFIK